MSGVLEDIGRKVGLPGALEPVDAQEVNTKLHGGLGMPDSGALVQDDAAGLLQLGDDGTRRVTSRLNNLDSLINGNLGISLVVWRNKGREQGDVDAERLARQLPALADFLAEAFRIGPNQSRDNTQTTRVGHGARHLGSSDMLPIVSFVYPAKKEE